MRSSFLAPIPGTVRRSSTAAKRPRRSRACAVWSASVGPAPGRRRGWAGGGARGGGGAAPEGEARSGEERFLLLPGGDHVPHRELAEGGQHGARVLGAA